jgi:hypothetical protein
MTEWCAATWSDRVIPPYRFTPYGGDPHGYGARDGVPAHS